MGYAGAKKCVAVFVLIKNVVWVWECQSKVDFVGRKSLYIDYPFVIKHLFALVLPALVLPALVLHHIVLIVMGG